MAKQQLSAEQKRLDIDIWIIALVTFGVFLCYAAMGSQLRDFVTDSSISVIPRLLLNAAIQFGVAGLGITIVCVLRKEKFTHFGLTRKNAFKAIVAIYGMLFVSKQTGNAWGCIFAFCFIWNAI